MMGPASCAFPVETHKWEGNVPWWAGWEIFNSSSKLTFVTLHSLLFGSYHLNSSVLWCWLLWLLHIAHQSLGHLSDETFSYLTYSTLSSAPASRRTQMLLFHHKWELWGLLWAVQCGVASLLILWLLLEPGSHCTLILQGSWGIASYLGPLDDPHCFAL